MRAFLLLVKGRLARAPKRSNTILHSHFALNVRCEPGFSTKSIKMPSTCGPILRFKKLTNAAFAPSRGSEQAAGLDLKSAYDTVVKARDRVLIKTDLQVCLPQGCYGRVAPRSGLALKHGIDVLAGVIDEDYRGNVGVILYNHGDTDFEIKAGDRIAQLICERIMYPVVQEVQDLDNTIRGNGGFGSTGA